MKSRCTTLNYFLVKSRGRATSMGRIDKRSRSKGVRASALNLKICSLSGTWRSSYGMRV